MRKNSSLKPKCVIIMNLEDRPNIGHVLYFIFVFRENKCINRAFNIFKVIQTVILVFCNMKCLLEVPIIKS